MYFYVTWFLGTCLIIVCILFLLVWRSKEKYHHTLKNCLEDSQKQFEVFKQEKEQEKSEMIQKMYSLSSQITQEKTLRESAEKEVQKLNSLFEKQDVLLQAQEKRLSDYFSNLSHQLVEQQREALRQENSHQLGHLLVPFKERLSEFQKDILSLRTSQAKQQGEFSEQIKQMMSYNHQLGTQAQALTQALTQQKKLQGSWGEMILTQLLESCGLQENIHFHIQKAFSTECAKRYIPDVVVNLPGKHHLIIDSKVSLNDYVRSVESDNQEDRQKAIQHAYEAVRKHVSSLSDKAYHNLLGMSSPDFVMMFMPLEGLYFTLLQKYPDLYQWAFDQGVILVSSSNLLPILRTISNVWVLANRQEEIETLVKQAEGIYDKALNMRDSIEKLGKSLGASVQLYNKMVGQYNGRDSLIKKLGKFKQISIEDKRQLDQPIHEVLEVPREQ